MSEDRTHRHTLEIPVIVPSQPHCARCLERLEASVRALAGVETVELDPGSGTIVVSHDTGSLPEERIEEEIRLIGLRVGKGVVHESWRVVGLD